MILIIWTSRLAREDGLVRDGLVGVAGQYAGDFVVSVHCRASDIQARPAEVGGSVNGELEAEVAIFEVVPQAGAGAAASGAVGVIVDGHGFLGDGELALGADPDSGGEG